MDENFIWEVKLSENFHIQELCQSFLWEKLEKPAHSQMGFLTFTSCKSESVLYYYLFIHLPFIDLYNLVFIINYYIY